jgi:hypothetical protein
MDKENVVTYTKWTTAFIRKKGSLSFVTIWMNLEDMMLSEISQAQKTNTL